MLHNPDLEMKMGKPPRAWVVHPETPPKLVTISSRRIALIYTKYTIHVCVDFCKSPHVCFDIFLVGLFDSLSK
jgi:hypothetical protein